MVERCSHSPNFLLLFQGDEHRHFYCLYLGVYIIPCMRNSSYSFTELVCLSHSPNLCMWLLYNVEFFQVLTWGHFWTCILSMFIAREYLNYVHNSSCIFFMQFRFLTAFSWLRSWPLASLQSCTVYRWADKMCTAPRTVFTDCFETLNLLLSWVEDVHALWI